MTFQHLTLVKVNVSPIWYQTIWLVGQELSMKFTLRMLFWSFVQLLRAINLAGNMGTNRSQLVF